MKFLKKDRLPIYLILTCIIFVQLSWILFFRDIRALKGFGLFYPIAEGLFSGRAVLLHYGLNSYMTILFGITGIASFGFYLYSLTQKISLKSTILFACIFQCILFFSYPVLSTDIFSYIFTERVNTAHHENIWKVIPATFSEDNFGKLADWKETTSVYGAVHFIIYYFPTIVGGNNIVGVLVLYKFIALCFALASMWILYKLLALQKHKDLSKQLRIVFWNPLFLLEIAGSGHNDIIMIFGMLAGFYFFQKKSFMPSGILFALAMQVKLIPIVLFFYCLLVVLRNESLKNGSVFFFSFLTINLASFLFMQVTPYTFLQRVSFNSTVYWQSLTQVLSEFRMPGGNMLIGIVLISVIVMSWKLIKKQINVVEAYAITILVYILFVTGAYWNWYVLWILPLVPFTKNVIVKSMIMLLTITSFFSYPLLWLILRINKPMPLWSLVSYLFLVIPVGLALFPFCKLRKLLADKESSYV